MAAETFINKQTAREGQAGIVGQLGRLGEGMRAVVETALGRSKRPLEVIMQTESSFRLRGEPYFRRHHRRSRY